MLPNFEALAPIEDKPVFVSRKDKNNKIEYLENAWISLSDINKFSTDEGKLIWIDNIVHAKPFVLCEALINIISSMNEAADGYVYECAEGILGNMPL